METARGLPGTSPTGGQRVGWLYSLRTRIALASGLITLVFMLGVTLATAWYLRREILGNAQAETRDMAQASARGLAENLRSITVATQQLARTASAPGLDRNQLRWIQRAAHQAVPGASGTLVALRPRAAGQEPYTVYLGERNRARDFDRTDYDYLAQDWYQRTLASDAGWWSEPRFSETAGDVWMVTYNQKLRPPAQGMVSLDMKLANLVHPIAELGKRPDTQATLLAPAGTIAYSSIPGIALEHSLEDYLRRSGRKDLDWALEAARAYRSEGRADAGSDRGMVRYTVVEPVGNTGWVLLLSQTYGEVMQHFNRALEILVGTSLLLTVLGTIAVRRLARQISRPVEQLARSAVKAIAGHDPTALPHQQRRDEVGLLARTLEQARQEIRQQMEEIERMGAARQKLESELAIARDIQRAMLPEARRLGSGGDERLEASALLEPAKVVGGDFYNFIERESGLWFVIGDVSDKGVPAALFMARAVTVLEVAIQAAATPTQALAEASRRLAQGNETCMFATVLCGCIDVRTGELALASAGHEPPLRIDTHGQMNVLELENGPPLGFEVSDEFPLWRGRLEPGECLLAYTDGVTEAFNTYQEAYGLERLRTLPGAPLDAASACQRVLADVQAFAAGAPPSDDITVLAIARGSDGSHRTQAHAAGAQGDTSVHISIAHTPDDVMQLTDAIDALLALHGADVPVRNDARLIIEEVASNAVTHAVSEDAPMEMHARVEERCLWLEFRDRGRPFDPTGQAMPDLDADIDERPIGGLGIYLVQQLASSVEYQRADGCNILRVTLRLDAAPNKERSA